MVVGVWELFLFLWSHPIISCMVLLLFSPPLFPVIVYFSPLLICTGLVAVAMVSMNIGGSAESEDGRQDGTRRLHEPAVHVEMQLKPVKESWLEWMRKLEERAKAWLESRLLNQENWRFGNITTYGIFQRGLSTPLLDGTSSGGSISPPVKEQQESMAVDKGLRISSPRDMLNLHPQLTRSDIHTLQTSRDNLSELTEVPDASNDRFCSCVPQTETEEIQQVYDAQHVTERSPVEASSLVVALSLVQEEGVQRENLLLSATMGEEVLSITRDENTSNDDEGILLKARDENAPEEEVLLAGDENAFNEEMLPGVAEKDEKLGDESPLSNDKSKPTLDENAIEVGLVLLQENILPPGFMDESVCEPSADEDLVEVLTMMSANASSARVDGTDHVTRTEPLISAYGKPSGDPEGIPGGLIDGISTFQTNGYPHGNLSTLGVVVPLEPNVSDDGEASPEKKINVFAVSDHLEVNGTTERLMETEFEVNGITERPIETEKIIFVDEPSNMNAVSSRPSGAEIDRNETSPIHKSSGHMVVEESELPNRSSREGVDENIEACGNVPSTTITASSLPGLEPMALVNRSGMVKNLPSTTDDSIQSVPDWIGLERPSFREEKIEPVRFPVNDDALSVLDRSHCVNTNAEGEVDGEVSDDLTERFVALKKSMSLYSNKQQEPISLRSAEVSTNAMVVPAFSPSIVSPLERNPFSESLVFPEKRKARPITISGAVEYVESVDVITARLQKKYIPNSAKDDSIIVPVKEELNKPILQSTMAIVPASVERDTRDIIGTGCLTAPIDVAPIKMPDYSNLKKSLSSFLSRRREKLMSPLMEAFSNSSDGDREKKLNSGSLALTKSEVADVLDRDAGSTTTSPRVKLLKGKVMSPLKRVFSMDANAGSSKKVEAGRVSSVKSSSVKDKHSVKDRPKDRLMKLFSFDGRGMSKLEMVEALSPRTAKPTVLNRIALRKSKSVSANSGQKKAEVGTEEKGPVQDENVLSPTRNSALPSGLHVLPRRGEENVSGLHVLPRGEEENVPVQGDMVLSPTRDLSPLPGDNVLETVDVESETKMLPRIETLCYDKRGEVLDRKLEPLLASSPEKRIPPTTIEIGRTDHLHNSSQEKKFTLSWMKKKRTSEPLDPVKARIRASEEEVSLSGKTNEQESREIFLSPLRRFNSSPAMNAVDEGGEEGNACSPLYENQSSQATSFRPSLKHREAPKAATPDKRSSTSWWSPKADPPMERGESPEKRVSTSWWSKRHSRADSKVVLGPSTSPTSESCSRNKEDIPAAPPENIIVSSASSWLKGRDNSNDDSNSLHIADEIAGPRQWRSRGRSDSLPTNNNSSSKFNLKLRERQTSFCEATLSRTSEQNFASSSGRVAVSMTDVRGQNYHYHHVKEKKRNDDLEDSNNTNNIGRRSNITTSTSYQIRRPVNKTVDLAQELRNSFNRSDVDVNNRHRRNSLSVAELSITDKLKVPLDEVLSLLSTGEKDDDYHRTTTADATVTDDHHRPSSSEVSSSNSSEEEWSSVSEDDDDEEEEPQEQQFVPLPPVGRIRRKLPHYIFSRGEATAN